MYTVISYNKEPISLLFCALELCLRYELTFMVFHKIQVAFDVKMKACIAPYILTAIISLKLHHEHPTVYGLPGRSTTINFC